MTTYDANPATSAPIAETGDQVVAAKLHVLDLEPIKTKLGKKWDKLSILVHKLFEKALKRAQGPQDHFIKTGELSYIATFRGLSFEEAGLACAAIAKQVCEQLFGDDVPEVSVRNLTGTVSAAAFMASRDGADIVVMLEEQGSEILIRHTSPNAAPRQVPRGLPGTDTAWISMEHAIATGNNISLGYFPVWDIRKRRSSTLFLRPLTGDQRTGGVRRLLGHLEETEILEAEIALLRAAAEYAQKVAKARRVCAIGVGVSFETLSSKYTRMRYIKALRSLRTSPTCPVLLKVDEVPDGIPLGRLAELSAMLVAARVRTLIEFQHGRALPQFDIRLGVSGFGAILPERCEPELAAGIAQQLVRRAVKQNAFVFLGGLANDALLEAALRNDVRLGTGDALDSRYYTGREPIPDFPLVASGPA